MFSKQFKIFVFLSFGFVFSIFFFICKSCRRKASGTRSFNCIGKLIPSVFQSKSLQIICCLFISTLTACVSFSFSESDGYFSISWLEFPFSYREYVTKVSNWYRAIITVMVFIRRYKYTVYCCCRLYPRSWSAWWNTNEWRIWRYAWLWT